MNHQDLQPGMLWRNKTSETFNLLIKVERLNPRIVHCEWYVAKNQFFFQSYFDVENFKEFQKEWELIP